jgi:hypothetical protein
LPGPSPIKILSKYAKMKIGDMLSKLDNNDEESNIRQFEAQYVVLMSGKQVSSVQM